VAQNPGYKEAVERLVLIGLAWGRSPMNIARKGANDHVFPHATAYAEVLNALSRLEARGLVAGSKCRGYWALTEEGEKVA
jgi:transcriptional regulator GlxA family with amidase domain